MKWWSNLFSSNLVAFCFSRFRSHIATDKPDKRVAPVAAPETMLIIWDGEAVEKRPEVNIWLFKLNVVWVYKMYISHDPFPCLFYLDRLVSLLSNYHGHRRSAAHVRLMSNLDCMWRNNESCTLAQGASSWYDHFQDLRALGILRLCDQETKSLMLNLDKNN